MATIDERVVEMRFDNKDFESNVKTSLGTIDKLKKALDFGNTSKSVEEFQSSVNNLHFGDIGASVEDVGSRIRDAFSFGVIASFGQALTNHVLEKLQAIRNVLMLDQISDTKNMIAGWEKYAEKTQAVATIMAATGDSIEAVNAQMDKLNYFTDETSYDFTDMANNIGKFTANGIGLEDASIAMQGISTWAAISGQNAATAGRAMYNLAQAIGMGALKLQDWKSIELANMGTKEFKETALETAAALGVLVKSANDTYTYVNDSGKEIEIDIQNFRESLKEGWLDNDVLMATLTEYGKAAELINEIHNATGLYARTMFELLDSMEAGTFTTEQLSEALDKEGDALAYDEEHLADVIEVLKLLGSEEYAFSVKTYKAAQESRTFGDAMKSVADAVSTGWMKTFELIFGGYDQAKKLWSDLAENLFTIFRYTGDKRNALLSEANIDGVDKLNAELVNAGSSMDALEAALKETMGESAFDQLIAKCGDFKEALRSGEIGTKLLELAIDKLTGKQTGLSDATEGTMSTFDEYTQMAYRMRHGEFGWEAKSEQIKGIMENYGYTAEQAELIYNWAVASHNVHRDLTLDEIKELGLLEGMEDQYEIINNLTEEQREAIKAAAREDLSRKGASASFVQGLQNLGQAAATAYTKVRDALSALFPKITAEQLANFAAAFERGTAKLLNFVEGNETLEYVLIGLAAPFRILVDIAKVLLSLIVPLGQIILLILSPLINAVAAFGQLFSKAREATGALNPVTEVILKFGEALKLILSYIFQVGKYVTDIVRSKLMERLAEPIGTISKNLKQLRENKLAALDKFIENLKNANVEDSGNKIVNILRSIYHFAERFTVIGSWFSQVIDEFKSNYQALSATEGVTGLQRILTSLEETIRYVFGKIGNKLRELGVDVDGLKARFQPFIDFFKNAKDLIVKTITTAVESFKNHLKSLKTEEGLSGLTAIFKALKAAAVDTFDRIVKYLSSLGTTADGVKTKFGTLIDFIASLFSKNGASDVLNSVDGLSDEVSDRLAPIREAFKGLFDDNGESISKYFKIVGGAGAVALGGGLIANLFAFAKGLKNVKDVADSKNEKGGLIKGAIEYLDPFADEIDKVKAATSNFSLIGFAVGVGILALSLIALSNVPADKLKTGLAGMGGALLEFITTLGAANLILGNRKSFGMIGMGLGLMAMAKALMMFVDVFEAYKDIDTDSGRAVIKVMAILYLAVKSMGHLAKVAGKNKFKKSNALGLVITAGALWLFGKVLEKYAKLNINSNNIKRVLAALIMAVGSMGILAFIAGKSRFKLSNGLGFLALAASMFILAGVVSKLGRMDPNELKQGMKYLVGIAVVLTAMIGIFELLSKFTTFGKMLGVFLVLIAVTTAMIVFSALVVVLGLIPQSFLDKGIDTISRIGTMIEIFAGISGLIGRAVGLKGAIATFLLLGAVVLATIAFAGLLVVLTVLAPALIVGFGSLVLVLIAMGVSLFVLRGLAKLDIKSVLIGLGLLLGFGLALIPLVYVLHKLSTLPYAETIEGLKLLGLLLLGFVGLISIAIIVGALATVAGPIFLIGMGVVGILLLGFVGSIAILVAELEKLAALDHAAAREGIACIKEELGILTDLATQFMENEGLFGASLEAALTIFAFGVGLAPLVNDTRMLSLIDAKKVTPGIQAVDELLDYLISLRTKFEGKDVEFKDAINVSAIVLSFGVGLYPLATDTKMLGLVNAENVKPAIEAMDSLILIMITLANTIGTDPTMFTKAITVSAEIGAFGLALLPLCAAELVAGLADSTNVVANLTQISSLIDQFFGLAGKMGEDEDLYTGATAVTAALKSYAWAIAHLIADELFASLVDYEKSTEGMKAVKEMIDELLILATMFQGEDSVAEGAEAAVTTLKGFAVALGGLVADTFVAQLVNYDKATTGLQAVKDLIDWLLETALAFGSDPTVFSNAEALASAANTFGTAVGKLTVANFFNQFVDAQKALDAVQPIKSLVDLLVTTALIFKDNGPKETFDAAEKASEACVEFAGSLKKLANAEHKINKTNAEAAKEGLVPIETVINLLIKMAKEFADNKGLVQAASDAATAVDVFSSKLKNVANNLSDGILESSWSNLDSEKVTSIITAIVDAITQLVNLGPDLGNATAVLGSVGDIFEGLSKLKTTTAMGKVYFDVESIKNAITEVLNAVKDMAPDFYTAGAESIDGQIATGIKENTGPIIESLTGLRDSMSDIMDGIAKDYNTIGWNIVAGIASGIYEGGYMATDAMEWIAKSMQTAYTNTMIIESPSRVMARLSEYIPAGIAQGIENNADEAIDSITYLGNTLTLAMAYAMQRLNDTMETDYTFAPIISPVVDMNNATSGLDQLTTLFNAVGLTESLGKIDLDTSVIDRSSNKDVVNELQAMNNRIAELAENMENLQIVLDTGVLVGSTSPMYDSQFGTMSMHKKRGN